MIRNIVEIDQEKCNGCGLCAKACHEGAIAIENGKAKLIKDDYCDGLGDCLPNCPVGAITIVQREAVAYDEDAVKRNKETMLSNAKNAETVLNKHERMQSKLLQWPTQIKLMPFAAPFYDGAKLLVAADCTAFAYANMHSDFIDGRITVNGCPKLDNVDYADKLAQILRNNNILEILVVRMQVPCCGGLENAVKRAVAACGKDIPMQTVVISIKGNIVSK